MENDFQGRVLQPAELGRQPARVNPYRQMTVPKKNEVRPKLFREPERIFGFWGDHCLITD